MQARYESNCNKRILFARIFAKEMDDETGLGNIRKKQTNSKRKIEGFR